MFRKDTLLFKLLTRGSAAILLIGAVWLGLQLYFSKKVNAIYEIRFHSNAVWVDVQAARLAEKDYFLYDLYKPEFYERGKTEHLDRHHAAMQSLRKNVSLLLELSPPKKDPELLDLQKLADRYEAEFQELVAAYFTRGFGDWGLEGAWKKAIFDVETEFEKQQLPALDLKVLKNYMIEKVYSTKGEIEYQQQVNLAFEKVKRSIVDANAARGAVILDSLKRYEENFRNYMAVQQKMGLNEHSGLQGQLNATTREMERKITHLLDEAMADGKIAYDLYTRFSLISVISAILFSAFVFFVFARSITKPILSLEKAAEAIGAGELETHIPLCSRDEIGRLAESFRTMATNLKHSHDQLIAARELALKAVRVKSAFLANMSHEIRTPMNGIVGMADLLHQTPLTPEQKNYVDALSRSGEALLFIINDILDFSKIEAGKLKLQPVEFNLRSLVEEVLELFAPKADARDLDLVCDMAPDVPEWVLGDPVRIRQILMNLLSNATKFTHNGEVVLSLTATPGQCDMKEVHFEVKDTGIGIAQEHQAMLFQPFSQVENPDSRRAGGTGLGLAISRELVELMHGRIGINSEAGKGSTFTFSIPFTVPSFEEKEEQHALRKVFRSIHVLIVDDNASTRKAVRSLLQTWNVNVQEAATTSEALRLFKNQASSGKELDFIIIDSRLSGTQLPELLDYLNSDVSMPGLQVVLLSPFSHRKTAEDLLCRGVDKVLVKPLKKMELYSVLSGEVFANDAFQEESNKSGMDVRNRLRKGRILIVDDNEINQQLAASILQKLGYETEIADDGDSAIEAARRHEFRMILMDVQMPKMNGLEAAREMRRKGLVARHIPIVAMTANVSAAEREKYLQTGMDDFLGKPFKFVELKELVDYWLEPPSRINASQAMPAILKKESLHVEQDELLERLNQVRQECGNQVVGRIIDLFLEHVPQRIDRLKEGVRKDDFSAVVEHAHTLKGLCGNLGAMNLAALSSRMETEAKQKSSSSWPVHVEAIQQDFQEISRNLLSYKLMIQQMDNMPENKKSPMTNL